MDKKTYSEHIQIQDTALELPVTQWRGEGVGPQVLITAGMDGDEYAGIEAAKMLCHDMPMLLNGQVTIILLMNTWGYNAGVSINPIDNMYPKYIYPGKKTGTATEQLIWWLTQAYVRQSTIWIDLHGGATDEYLYPFIFIWATGAKQVDGQSADLARSAGCARIVCERAPWRSREYRIGHDGASYILCESGERGSRAAQAVKTHVRWVIAMLRALGMNSSPAPSSTPTMYTRVYRYLAPHDGYWVSQKQSHTVAKGQVVGELRAENGNVFPVSARTDGALLWGKVSGIVKKGTLLVTMGERV